MEDDPDALDIPDSLLAQLSAFIEQGLFSEENVASIIDQLPEEARAPAEMLLPLLETPGGAIAVVEVFFESMTPEQQTNIEQVSQALADGAEGVDLADLGAAVAAEASVVLGEQITNPEFIGHLVSEVVNAVGEDGDPDFATNSLVALLQPLLPESLQGVVEPLLRFMNLAGEDVSSNLERLRGGESGGRFPMDGPLRSLVLVVNALAYSTSLGATNITATSQSEAEGFDVYNSKFEMHTDLKWWIPTSFLQGMDMVLRTMDLSRTRISLMRHEIEDGVLLMPTLDLETIPRDGEAVQTIALRGVRAGLSENYRDFQLDSLDNLRDVYFLLAMYEDAIRDNIGKFTSLFDWGVRLGRSPLAKWVMQMFNFPENIIGLVDDSWKKRDAVQQGIADMVLNVSAATAAATPEATQVYTGISMGGSIAQLIGMHTAIACEECKIVALTLNSGGVDKLAKTMKLKPKDNRQWWQKVIPKQTLAPYKDRFRGFVNFAMQHDVLWKLDKPLVGSNMCMFMHPAEDVGCRGFRSVKDVYHSLLEADGSCRKDFWQEDTDELPGGTACTMRRAAPAVGCLLKEHFMTPAEDLDTSSGLDLEGINITLLANEFAAVYNINSDIQFLTVKEMEKAAGWTDASFLTLAEENQRQAEREAAYAVIEEWAQQQIAAANQEIGGLPTCDGCPDPWCASKDLREEKCCAKECKDSRMPCGGEARHETCSGVVRAIKNFPSTPQSFGMTCQCKPSFCFDALTGSCIQDGYDAQRMANVTGETENAKRRAYARELWADIKEQRQELWEASVVKKKSPQWVLFHKVVDAKPNPFFDRKWACSF